MDKATKNQNKEGEEVEDEEVSVKRKG